MRTSETITEIAKALSKFQGEVTNPKHSAKNPHWKNTYTPLQDIISHIKPALANNGLSFLQNPYSEDGNSITVTTLLMHSSGEWIESDPLTMKAERATAQGAGSIITYARRYSLSAILGIGTEEDDDGNSGEGAKQTQPPQQQSRQKAAQPPKTRTQEKAPAASQPPKEKQQVKDDGFITVDQARVFFSIVGEGNEDIVKDVLGKQGIKKTTETPVLLYQSICQKLIAETDKRKEQELEQVELAIQELEKAALEEAEAFIEQDKKEKKDSKK